MWKWIKAISVLVVVFFMLIGMGPGMAVAEISDGKTDEQLELTIEKAVDMAINHDGSIKQAEYDIERGEEVRDFAGEQVQYTPTGPTPDAALKAFYGLVSADIGFNMAKKSKNIEEDKVIVSVLEEYTDVLKAIENLNLAQKSVEKAEWNWRINQLRFQIGQISLYQKDASKVQYTLAQNTLESAQIELEDAYQTLNELVGLEPEDRPILTETPEYNKLLVGDLEGEIQKAVEDNPAIWLVDQKIKLEEINRELYDWTNPLREPYEVINIDIQKAERNASDSRIQLEQMLRTLYNNIVKLEESYNSQREVVNTAKETLRITNIKQEIGVATKDELQNAELSLAKEIKTLNEIIYQHEILKMNFEKPWTAGAK